MTDLTESPATAFRNPPAAPPFGLGVASFDPTPDAVLIWCAVEGGGTCHWEIATDEDFFDIVARGKQEAAPETGIVSVDVTGLQPGTAYWYRFTAQGRPSPVGRTRTLPADSAEHLRIGVTCCARYGQSPFAVYGELAHTDVDVVVHLGDYVYEDTKYDIEERRPVPDHDCVTVEDYRQRHAQARADPDLQALHARHPMVVIWDDHDLADNAWRGGAKSHDPDTQGPWVERRRAALVAHHEHLSKRLVDNDDPARAWRALDAGTFARLVATETRAHRDEPAGHEGTAPADAPERTMLGPDQEAWIGPLVADPAPRWLVLLSGTVLSPLTIPTADPLDGLLPEKYAVVDGEATNTDQWDGYQANRDRLAAALARRGGRTITLSGDIHSSWAIEGPCGADGRAVGVELVCPPAATRPMGQLFPAGAGEKVGPVLVELLPGVRWVDTTHHGFLVLTLTEDEAVATWWWVDPDRQAPTEVGHRLTIPAEGRPRLVGLASPVAPLDPEADDEAPESPLADQHRRRNRRRLALTVLAAAAGALGLRHRHRST
ncbi:MAG: alkaline phosphatase D family protein [Acidimicrobiia bacterium]